MGIKKKDKTLKNSFRCRNTILARNWQKNKSQNLGLFQEWLLLQLQTMLRKTTPD